MLFKKHAIFHNKHRLEATQSPTISLGDDILEKTRTRQELLEELQMTITHQPNKPSALQPEVVEQQKSIGDFLSYVNWLSCEGFKQYKVSEVKKVKFGMESNWRKYY